MIQQLESIRRATLQLADVQTDPVESAFLRGMAYCAEILADENATNPETYAARLKPARLKPALAEPALAEPALEPALAEPALERARRLIG